MKQKIVIFVSLLAASTAAAQNSDLGLKLGEKSRLHVGVDLATGFDTNPNYLPMSSGMIGDMTLALRPELALVIPDDMIDVDASVRLNYQEFFGLMDSRTAQLRQIDGDANFTLEINRKGMFGFALSDRVTRALDPGAAALGARLARIRNDAGLGVELRPGGGLLTVGLHYNFGIELYDRSGTVGILDTLGLYASNTQLTNPEYFDNMDHQLKLRTEWRFLPKTGLFLDISGGSRSYLNSASPNVAAFPVGIEIGAMGQISGKLAGVVKLGYANPITVDKSGAVTSATFIGAVGQLELRYAITETNVVTAGIRREMRPIYMYSFFTDNRIYVESHHQLMEKLQIKANVAYALLAFDAATGSQNTTYVGGNRMDNLVEAHLSARYFIMDWLALGISDALQLNFTNAASSGAGGGNFSFWKNLTLLSITANY